jgi:NTP pyrophosphatase (non-canonical NTP hydrolase)
VSTFGVLIKVNDERAAQDERWGEQNHDPAMWLAILTEEIGEVAKEVADGRIQPFNDRAYHDELIQVAAVAVAAVESLNRSLAS